MMAETKLNCDEIRDYLTDIEWQECDNCQGTGCELCDDEGGRMEASDG